MVQLSQFATDSHLSAQNAHELEELVDYLKQSHSFDFTGYKRSSLMRRLSKRMQQVGIKGYRDYINYIKVQPQEFTHLFNTVLINHTSFFRDRLVWDYLTQQVIPQIVASKEPNAAIRVWSAGCASGEEAYTLAIVLAEVLGEKQFRRVQIYATDIDEDALNQARLGTYTTAKVTGIPPTLLKKYFNCTADSYSFRQDLRGSVLFGRHNLIDAAPMLGIDLIVCRNVLMYYNPEAQRKILSRLHDALCDNSFLLLGQVERISPKTQSFTQVDSNQRIYQKTSKRREHVFWGGRSENMPTPHIKFSLSR